jgi:hypothetical protein
MSSTDPNILTANGFYPLTRRTIASVSILTFVTLADGVNYYFHYIRCLVIGSNHNTGVFKGNILLLFDNSTSEKERNYNNPDRTMPIFSHEACRRTLYAAHSELVI